MAWLAIAQSVVSDHHGRSVDQRRGRGFLSRLSSAAAVRAASGTAESGPADANRQKLWRQQATITQRKDVLAAQAHLHRTTPNVGSLSAHCRLAG